MPPYKNDSSRDRITGKIFTIGEPDDNSAQPRWVMQVPIISIAKKKTSKNILAIICKKCVSLKQILS